MEQRGDREESFKNPQGASREAFHLVLMFDQTLWDFCVLSHFLKEPGI